MQRNLSSSEHEKTPSKRADWRKILCYMSKVLRQRAESKNSLGISTVPAVDGRLREDFKSKKTGVGVKGCSSLIGPKRNNILFILEYYLSPLQFFWFRLVLLEQ